MHKQNENINKKIRMILELNRNYWPGVVIKSQCAYLAFARPWIFFPRTGKGTRKDERGEGGKEKKL
jgi:hypothetical protein